MTLQANREGVVVSGVSKHRNNEERARRMRPRATAVCIVTVSCFFLCLRARAQGTVWTWGYNYFGQLGDGMFTFNTLIAAAQTIIDAVTGG